MAYLMLVCGIGGKVLEIIMAQRKDGTNPLSYENCIELMPEWKGRQMDITPLTGGITNRLYRVRLADGGDYVVRIYGQKTELFIDRDMETQSIKTMEPSGVVPKLIRYLPEKQVTIVEFIPGRVMSNDNFLDHDLLELLIRPIKLIHNCPVRLPRLFDPLVEVNRLFTLLQNVSAGYPEFDIAGTIKIMETISALADVPHSQYLPCHNDLLADNFIMVEDRLKHPEPVYLIDWEYAGMNTPYYEFSDMFQEILLPRDIEQRILSIYFEDQNIDEHMRKTDMFRPFPDMYWFLWSLIQLNVSAIEFDYYNYGRVKYENAGANIKILRHRYGLRI
jgi:thiamine kinase-like enzyme